MRLLHVTLALLLTGFGAPLRATEPEPSRGQAVRQTAIQQAVGPAANELRYHALIIGINDYRAWRDLVFAETDAARLARTLRESYEFQEINLLTGERATRAAILAALQDYATRLTAEDALLIFYAGHGYAQLQGSAKDGYWIPCDGQPQDLGTEAPASWVSMDELHAFMEKTAARHVLLVSDSCYAGAFFTRGESPPLQRAIQGTEYAHQIAKPSRYVLTSGDMEEVPDRSRFVEEFLRELESDRVVFSAEDIYFNIKRPVESQSEQDVVAREMVRGQAGGNFIFIQKSAFVPDALIVVKVAPPDATLTTQGTIYSRSRSPGESETTYVLRAKPLTPIHLRVEKPGSRFIPREVSLALQAEATTNIAISLRKKTPNSPQ